MMPLTAAAMLLATMLAPPPSLAPTTTLNGSIRAYQVHVREAQIADLKRRIAMTRWPDKETVGDRSQGFQLGDLQQLLHYWGTAYDWRKAEARLDALPQFKTNIDGLDIYFIQVRSKNPNALPLIMTHGWPGSVFELMKAIDPLANPTAHGGKAADSFDVVIPSMPGYGFSDRPRKAGWNPEHIARAWDILMKRLGYTRYVAQGGDWGAVVTELMGEQAPPGLLGIHVNLPATVPQDIAAALGTGIAPAGLSDKELVAFNALVAGRKARGTAYFDMLTARPQSVGYAMSDSPAALAAFLLVHGGFSRWKFGGTPQSPLSTDDVLDDFTLYWLTDTGASANRLYWENQGRSPVFAAALKTDQIKVPVAVTVFPFESYPAPESWARRAYPKLIYFHEVDRGGHFAAWEQPELFADELRAAFRSLR
jgi:pimeloyl-ACP methyl ester carboxylesterase